VTGPAVPARSVSVVGTWPTIGVIITITCGAWWFLITATHSAPPLLHWHHQPLTVLGFTSTWVMWVVMMTAMMLPSVLPWLVAFHAANGQRGPRNAASRSALFGLGYLTTWSVFSLLAALVQIVVIQHGVLNDVSEPLAGAMSGALLIGAGVYQVNPRRTACLRRCRSPMSFFLTSWRGGRTGALTMGLLHGRNCVACCWALMLVSFALGVMNLLWMGTLTLVICIERWTPRGITLGRVFGVGLISWGIWLLGT
jgi:predicted metal-binding membrane protein